MTKQAYIGVDNVARKITKGYIGINDVARKIKKAYIGIGGVARPCWNGGVPTYYGTIDDFKVGVITTGVVGDYALFPIAGGKGNVRTYDKSLTRGRAPAFYKNSTGTASRVGYGVNLGDILIFNAGLDKKLVIYDRSLTVQYLDLLPEKKEDEVTGELDGYAYFAGGDDSSTVFVVNKSLTLQSVHSLDYKYKYPFSVNVQNERLVFATDNGISASVYGLGFTYKVISLGKYTEQAMTASLGNHGLIINTYGGETPADNNLIKAIDRSLTFAYSILPDKRYYCLADKLGDVAVVVGGTIYDGASKPYETSLLVNDSLTSSYMEGNNIGFRYMAGYQFNNIAVLDGVMFNTRVEKVLENTLTDGYTTVVYMIK